MTKRNILLTVVSLLISTVLCGCGIFESDIYSDMPQPIVNTISESDVTVETTSQNTTASEIEFTSASTVEETTLLTTTPEETTVTTTTVITTTIPIITTTTVPVTEATTTTTVPVITTTTTTVYIPLVTEAPEIITTAVPETVQYNSSVVYVASSGRGKKYHNNPKCSNMKGTNSLSVEDAIARGYTPCKKCY